MITNILSNKKLNSVVTELFIRGSKIKISLLFIMQSLFEVPKIVRLNTKHYFIIKAQQKKKKKKEKISTNCILQISSDNDFKDFMYFYIKKYCKTNYFLVIDATLASDNP